MIAVPLLLLMIMSVIQFGLWQHANHVAQSAAEEGARSARLSGGTSASGKAQAQDFVHQLGDGLVLDPVVSVSNDGQNVRVVVSGRTESMLPGVRLPVNGVSQGPVERFRAAGGA